MYTNLVCPEGHVGFPVVVTTKSLCTVDPELSEPTAIRVVSQSPVAVEFTLTLRVRVVDEPAPSGMVV